MVCTFPSRWQGHFQVDGRDIFKQMAGTFSSRCLFSSWGMITVHRAGRVDQWDPPQGMCADRSLHIQRGWGHVSKQVWVGERGVGASGGFWYRWSSIVFSVKPSYDEDVVWWNIAFFSSSFFLSEHHSLKQHFGRIHWLLTGQYSICSFFPPHLSVGAHLHNRCTWYLQDRYIYMVLLFLTSRHVRNMAWKFGNHTLTLTCNVTMPSLWLVIYAARQRENAECSGDRNVIVRMPATQNHSLPSFRPVYHIFM